MNCDSSSFTEEKRQHHLWLLTAMNRPYFWYIGTPCPQMSGPAPAVLHYVTTTTSDLYSV